MCDIQTSRLTFFFGTLTLFLITGVSSGRSCPGGTPTVDICTNTELQTAGSMLVDFSPNAGVSACNCNLTVDGDRMNVSSLTNSSVQCEHPILEVEFGVDFAEVPCGRPFGVSYDTSDIKTGIIWTTPDTFFGEAPPPDMCMELKAIGGSGLIRMTCVVDLDFEATTDTGPVTPVTGDDAILETTTTMLPITDVGRMDPSLGDIMPIINDTVSESTTDVSLSLPKNPLPPDHIKEEILKMANATENPITIENDHTTTSIVPEIPPFSIMEELLKIANATLNPITIESDGKTTSTDPSIMKEILKVAKVSKNPITFESTSTAPEIPPPSVMEEILKLANASENPIIIESPGKVTTTAPSVPVGPIMAEILKKANATEDPVVIETPDGVFVTKGNESVPFNITTEIPMEVTVETQTTSSVTMETSSTSTITPLQSSTTQMADTATPSVEISTTLRTTTRELETTSSTSKQISTTQQSQIQDISSTGTSREVPSSTVSTLELKTVSSTVLAETSTERTSAQTTSLSTESVTTQQTSDTTPEDDGLLEFDLGVQEKTTSSSTSLSTEGTSSTFVVKTMAPEPQPSSSTTEKPPKPSTELPATSTVPQTDGIPGKRNDTLDDGHKMDDTLIVIVVGSVIGVIVVIAIIFVIASFCKSRRKSANITMMEKGGIQNGNGASTGIDNPLVQLQQEQEMVETNPNPKPGNSLSDGSKTNGSMEANFTGGANKNGLTTNRQSGDDDVFMSSDNR